MSRTSTSSRSASALPSRAFHSASASFSAAWCSRLVRIGRSSILATSNRSGIDSVVLAMRADEPDEHHAPVVVHRYDETIVVALDVETTRLFAMKLAFRYAALISAGARQSARLASAYPERSGISASRCVFRRADRDCSA